MAQPKLTFRNIPSTGADEIVFEKNGQTLAEVLGNASIEFQGMTLRVNGQAATGETPVNDGDTVKAAPKVAGA